jgi:hypothetical protein
MSDHPTTAPFGSSDRPCRISTDTPVETADTELDHQNITIELSPSNGRARGSVDDYWPGEEIASWAAERPEFKEHPEFDPLDPEVIEDFKDYYRGEGKVSADWNASLKRWLRKELRYRASGRKRRNERQKAGSMMEAAVNEVRKETEIDG